MILHQPSPIHTSPSKIRWPTPAPTLTTTTTTTTTDMPLSTNVSAFDCGNITDSSTSTSPSDKDDKDRGKFVWFFGDSNELMRTTSRDEIDQDYDADDDTDDYSLNGSPFEMILDEETAIKAKPLQSIMEVLSEHHEEVAEERNDQCSMVVRPSTPPRTLEEPHYQCTTVVRLSTPPSILDELQDQIAIVIRPSTPPRTLHKPQNQSAIVVRPSTPPRTVKNLKIMVPLPSALFLRPFNNLQITFTMSFDLQILLGQLKKYCKIQCPNLPRILNEPQKHYTIVIRPSIPPGTVERQDPFVGVEGPCTLPRILEEVQDSRAVMMLPSNPPCTLDELHDPRAIDVRPSIPPQTRIEPRDQLAIVARLSTHPQTVEEPHAVQPSTPRLILDGPFGPPAIVFFPSTPPTDVDKPQDQRSIVTRPPTPRWTLQELHDQGDIAIRPSLPPCDRSLVIDTSFTHPDEEDEEGQQPAAGRSLVRDIHNVSQNFSEDSEAINELLQILRRKDSDLSHLPVPVRRRLKDFRFAQCQRLKKYSIKPFGIVGLFCNLSDIRADLRWAQDAAWRREYGKRYVSWTDYEAHRNSHGLVQPYFTSFITFTSIAMMIYAFHLNGWRVESLKVNPLVGPSPETLLTVGALQTNLVVNGGEWWRLFCPIVLHAGLVHLIVNMVVIYPVGRAIEQNHGTVMATILFVMPALGGNILSAVMQPGFVLVGASGGIFGWIGVCVADIALNWKLIFLVLEQHHGTSIWRWICCLFWLIFDLIVNSLIGFTPFVDNFAHLGGLAYGFLIALSILERLPLGFFGQGMQFCYMLRIGFMRLIGLSLAAFLGVVSVVLLLTSDGTVSVCWKCRYISCVPFPFWTEDKWWRCDGCDAISGDVYFHPDGEHYAELDLFCPNGDIERLDIYDEKFTSTAELLVHLPTYCREVC
jgi:membrane associated rhomboid family serine protease